MNPWDDIATGQPGDPDWAPLSWLCHGSHRAAANDIAAAGQITATPIGDGVLASSGQPVVFLSPNPWGGRSRYGAIQFVAHGPRLTASRQLFWVEEGGARVQSNRQIRFLLTCQGQAGRPITPYDPVRDLGPLRQAQDGELHWYGRSIALEILVDEDIPLTKFDQLELTGHTDGICRLGLRPCPDAADPQLALGLVLADLVVNSRQALNPLLAAKGPAPARPLNSYVDAGLLALWRHLVGGARRFGGPLTSDAQAQDAVITALHAALAGDDTGTRAAIGQIHDEALCERAFEAIVAAVFDAPAYRLPA